MSERNKTIKEKNEELSKIIEWFNSSSFDIELAFERFKQAEILANDIEKELVSMKNEINIIKKKFDVAS